MLDDVTLALSLRLQRLRYRSTVLPVLTPEYQSCDIFVELVGLDVYIDPLLHVTHLEAGDVDFILDVPRHISEINLGRSIGHTLLHEPGESIQT